MARDESQQQPDESTEAESSEPITITTSDPAIESSVEHTSDWKIHPDSTLSVETTQVHEPNPLYVVGVRKVVHEDQDNNGKDGGQKKGNQGADPKGQNGGDQKEKKGGQEDGGGQKGKGKAQNGSEGGGKAGSGQKSGRQQQKQPSLMKSLLMTAGIATVCGLVGAFGYSYFAGSSSGKGSSEQGESKGKSGSSKSSMSSGGGGSKQGKNESEGGQSDATTKVALVAAREIGTLNQQLVDLMVRVDRLGERVDRIVRPNDEVPPVVQTLELEIGEIFHELDKLAKLDAKVREYDSRLETLQREIKVLRSQLDSGPGKRTDLAKKPETAPGSEPMPGANESSSAQSDTLDRGLRLLEQGQYETARGVFARLERRQPADARVWYFAALAVGLASGDWNDSAKELALKGVDCERAGSPAAGDIDATIATRGPAEGKAWLNALRQRSLGANRTP